jgi:hypothetical protein
MLMSHDPGKAWACFGDRIWCRGPTWCQWRARPATRLRGGSANTARGAASLPAEAIDAARENRCTGLILARMYSGYCNAALIGACTRVGARFSVKAPPRPAVKVAIAASAV